MTKLEKVTQFVLITVCLVSLGVLVKNGLFAAAADPPGMDQLENRLIGRSEPTLPVSLWKGSQRSVVVLLSSDCHFCSESMPLYQKLSSMRKQGGGFSLLAVGREEPNTLRDYLIQNKIGVDGIVQAPAGFATVKFTPAVFVVDSRGAVQEAFLGKLNSAHEKKLLQLVGAKS